MALFVTLKYTTTGTTPQSYYFRGRSDIYSTAITAETGVSVAPAAEQDRPSCKIEELVARGVLVRLMASTGTLGTGAARKQVKMLCGRDKLATAIGNLITKPVRGSAILSVRIPQKSYFLLVSWENLGTINCSENWQLTVPAAFTYCRIKVVSAPTWGRGLIAQASVSEPHDFYQIRRVYGFDPGIIRMDCPDCFQGLQSIAIKQVLGYFWTVSIDVWI